MVTINGVLQHPSDATNARAYTLIASIIQFTAAPANGVEIQVRHIGFAGATTADVSGFYGRTGNVVLGSTDHITTGDITARNINASGILTASSASFGGNVSIGGTLSYEDVTNVDAVGLATFRDGIVVQTGTATTALIVEGNARVTGILTVGTGSITLNENANTIKVGTALTLGHTQGLQFHTQNLHSLGFEVNQINASGIITASQFKGDGSQLTGIDATALKDPAGNVKIQAQASGAVHTGIATFLDLDVDGHTNLDNVSIAGVTTASGDITITNTAPKLNLTDTNNNSDFRIKVESGQFDIDDTTSSNATRIRIYSNGEILIPNNVGFGVANPSEKVDVSGNIKVSGNITVSGTVDGVDISALNTTVGTKLANIVEDTSPQLGADLQSNGHHIYLSNEKYVWFGTTGTGIAGYSSGIFFEGNSTGKTIYIRPKLNQESIKAEVNGPVSLHHSGTKMFETDSGGCKSSKSGPNTFTIGSTDASGVYLVLDGDSNGDGAGADYCYLQHGTDGDFSIHCDNPNGDSQFELYTGGGTTLAMVAEAAGSVQLYHSGNQKLTTESDGVDVTGLMEADRTRNVPITTTQRDALSSPAEGTMVYNDTEKALQVYTDGQWISFSGKIINTSGGNSISNNSNRSGYVVHTFTSPGTFETDGPLQGVEIMVVGGGGGGGGHRYGSGGGAGGVIMRPGSSPTPAYPLSSPAPVVVGSGGNGSSSTGSSGQNSTFGTGPMTIIGKGGGGGTSYDGPVYPGRPGGSGGGATSRASSTPGGSATQPGTHGAGSDYGQRGGNYNVPGGGWAPCGGGGAGGHGVDTPGQINGGGSGGIGVQLSISGTATYYAGGGAASIYNVLGPGSSYYAIGGRGGGGSAWNAVPGSYPGHSAPGHGATNSGGGGCGAHGQNPSSIPIQNAHSSGRNGGSGIVIVAYPTTQPAGTVNVT